MRSANLGISTGEEGERRDLIRAGGGGRVALLLIS